ncbi:Protein CBG05516 [Caenorhabditis briggsae]|uniref:Protein CBG05516 n=1 Tax=Caenorhabditis briggsae TaxID=6238 RepID=A8X023_CAEBR|nr:Protein CBG05516 [Caenorhabditis briggsae]CAP25983.2 Protein CBG05516 [Caenorhabditis briggsae]
MSIHEKLGELSLQEAESINGSAYTNGTRSKKNKYGTVPLAPKLVSHCSQDAEIVQVRTNVREIVDTQVLGAHTHNGLATEDAPMNWVQGKDIPPYISIWWLSTMSSKHPKERDDYQRDLAMCRGVYRRAVEHYPQLQTGGPFFYDSQNSLWSLSQLNTEKLSFTIYEGVTNLSNFIKADFVLYPIEVAKELSTNDIENTATLAPADADKRLHQAITTILADGPKANPDVITVNGTTHYSVRPVMGAQEAIWFPNGDRSSLLGVTRAVKTMEGFEKQGVFMSNDMRISLFHTGRSHMTLADYFRTFQGFHYHLDRNDLRKACTRWERRENDSNPRIRKEADGPGIQLPDGTLTNVYEYFRNRYNVELELTELWTIESTVQSGGVGYYPPELLRVIPNQKVTCQQMTPQEQSAVIRRSAAKPHERIQTTDNVAAAVGLVPRDLSGFLQITEPLVVSGIVLKDPIVQNCGGFYNAMRQEKWGIVFLPYQTVRNAENVLFEEMHRSGMAFDEPRIMYLEPDNQFQGEFQIHRLFQEAKDNGIKFLLFIIPSSIDYQTEVKVYCTENAPSKGHESEHYPKDEYEVRRSQLQSGQRLLGQGEPPHHGILALQNAELGDSEVTTVGYASNFMDHPQKFAGSYKFVERTDEASLDSIIELLQYMITLQTFSTIIHETLRHSLQKARRARNMRAEKVVIYFNGISEGQLAMVNEVYAPQCIETFQSLRKDYAPELIILAASKTHNERLYLDSVSHNRGVHNLPIGTIVDTTIVSPVFNEFYHVGAKAIQGTAKPVKYTVVYSNRPVKMEWVEGLTNTLCHEHQIIKSPISIPVPLYIAAECAKRGCAILEHRQRLAVGTRNFLTTVAETGIMDMMRRIAGGQDTMLKDSVHVVHSHLS